MESSSSNHGAKTNYRVNDYFLLTLKWFKDFDLITDDLRRGFRKLMV